MTKKQVLNLKPGDKVIHSYFGPSTIKEVMVQFGELFGIQILPSTQKGRQLITANFGTACYIPFLEDSPRRLKIIEP